MSPFDHGKKAPSLLAYHRILSPSASIKVSPICLGAMNFGSKWTQLMGECTKETAFSILDFYHSSGGNFIDTANLYMGGESELWLGEWLTSRNIRDEMVIATKFSLTARMMVVEPEGSTAILSNYGGNNKKALRLSLQQSLENLKTDYVDIYYVHIWDGLTSIEELMHALHEVVVAGKVLYLGCSNWPAWLVVKANDYARHHSLTPFVVYEGRWNPAEREIEREILPMCKAEGMGIMVWNALGGGKFRVMKEEGGRNFDDAMEMGAPRDNFQKFAPVMEEIGKSKGTDATGVALRYGMLKAPYIFPIVGGRKIEHLKKNIAALSVNLSNEEIEKIEAAVPFDFSYPHIILSGDRTKQITSENPTFIHRNCGFFDGVSEPKGIRAHE
ncbi:NADP-dependent oxidoreductase domain-containing protein [Tricladium varicosporioides]|nr:NADP-dependent oxidoreductase domain-containing protein [Hymenoscyphus varicosporioides]